VLPAAHRHFHSQPAYAFPSRDHEWGVQNGVVQTLADLGIVGLLLLAATFAAAFRLLVRVLRRGPPDDARESLAVVGWLIVGIAVFTGTGLLPGLAVDAQLWLGLGLARLSTIRLHGRARLARVDGRDTWPGGEYRDPHRSLASWSIRRPLAEWLRREGALAAGKRVLDVGCGVKPYYPFFAGAAEYVGVDVKENVNADIVGTADAIPVRTGATTSSSARRCSSTSTIRLRSCGAVTGDGSGGRVLASTHGVMLYHPNPQDLWRWTHTGLARLFEGRGRLVVGRRRAGRRIGRVSGHAQRQLRPSAGQARAHRRRGGAGDQRHECARRRARRARGHAARARPRLAVREPARDGGEGVTACS
jgi:Lipid A core - O-antigen ligase and related enzymes